MPKKKDADAEFKHLLLHILQNEDTQEVECIEVTQTRYGKVENKYNMSQKFIDKDFN